ncbi:unnamed protein product [Cercospora beticola]|nr:unnamed protein product [Cercospora beticola]
MLAYCYGLYNAKDFDIDSPADDGWIIYCELLVAADKYRIEGLKIMVTKYLEHQMASELMGGDLSLIALWLYEGERRQIFGPRLTRKVMIELALQLDFVMNHGYWPGVLRCPELVTDLMGFVARRSSRVEFGHQISTPDHLCVNAWESDNDE